jgi:hypothetical protein
MPTKHFVYGASSWNLLFGVLLLLMKQLYNFFNLSFMFNINCVIVIVITLDVYQVIELCLSDLTLK